MKNLTAQNIQGIISTITKSLAPSPSRVFEPTIPPLEQEDDTGDGKNGESSRARWVGTGDVGLDEALGGGLRVGTLTEITGERSV